MLASLSIDQFLSLGLAPLPLPPKNPVLLGNHRVLALCGTAQFTDLRIETKGTFKVAISHDFTKYICLYFTYTFVHNYAYTRIFTLSHPRTRTRTQEFLCSHTHTNPCTNMLIRKDTCKHTRTCAHILSQALSHAHKHTHTYT